MVKSGRAAPQPFPFSSARPGNRMRVSGEEAGADSVSHAEIPRGVQAADVEKLVPGRCRQMQGRGTSNVQIEVEILRRRAKGSTRCR